MVKNIEDILREKFAKTPRITKILDVIDRGAFRGIICGTAGAIVGVFVRAHWGIDIAELAGGLIGFGIGLWTGSLGLKSQKRR